MLIGSFIYYSYGLADDFTDEDDTEGDKTYQKCGVPNATGSFALYSNGYSDTSVPVRYVIGIYTTRAEGKLATFPNGTSTYPNYYGRIDSDLSRASSVYQGNLTEARPDNITVQVWRRIA